MGGVSGSGGHGTAHLDLFPVDGAGNAPMATHVAVKDGDWFDPETWGGQVPGEGAMVHIPASMEVTYEGASDASLFMVRVDGTLNFMAEDGVSTKMVVDTLVTAPDSKLAVLAGRATDGTVDIVFEEGTPAAHADFYTDASAGDGVIGRYNWDPDQLSLGLVASGEVVVRGQEVAGHLQLETGPAAGDTSLVFDAWDEGASTWQPGQQIVVGATNFVGYDANNEFQTEDEVRTITAVEVDGTRLIVHIDAPLQYDHIGPNDPATGEELTTSVGNLSRNVTFSSGVADQNGDGLADRGTSLGEPLEVGGHYVTERGHVAFMHTDDVRVENSAFFGLGRTDKSIPLDDFVTGSNGNDGLAHRLHEDNGEIGVFDEGIDIALETPADEALNVRGRYAVHLHMAGIGDAHDHSLMDDEGGVIGPCARGGSPICHCSAIDEDGDGQADFYVHSLDDPHHLLGDFGEEIDTDGDGVVDAIRHDADTHRAFMSAQEEAETEGAYLGGNVVWGSPGWGIAQHDSRADLIDNVTFDVAGAAFVSETGNETGLWQGNAAFGTYGAQPSNISADDSDFNDDFGQEGVGFWLQSRALEVVDNLAVSSARTGFYYRNHGVDQIDVLASELGDLAAIRDGEDTVAPEDVPIVRFSGNEVIAAQEGIRIITDPLDSVRKFNDAYSHFSDFTAYGIDGAGVNITYSSKYIFEDFLILGNNNTETGGPTAGFFFRVSVADITVLDSHIEGFDHGVISWFSVGDRQEYRRGYWDPQSPSGGNGTPQYAGVGTEFGIDNPAYNLHNHNLIDVSTANLNTVTRFVGRPIEIENPDGTTTTYEARQFFSQSGDDAVRAKSEVDIELISDSAAGGLVALWREDLANAEDYAAVLANHTPLVYQENAFLSQIHFANGGIARRPTRLDEGDGTADDIWSGTVLEFVKTDSLGQQVFAYNDFSPLNPDAAALEVSTNERLVFTLDGINGVLERDGYYTSPGSGLKFVAIKQVFTDRLTGDFTTKEFLVALDLAWELPEGVANNGLYRPHAQSVIADSYAYFRDGQLLAGREPAVPQLHNPAPEAEAISATDGAEILLDAAFDTGAREGGYGPEAVRSAEASNARVLATDGVDKLENTEALTGVRDDLSALFSGQDRDKGTPTPGTVEGPPPTEAEPTPAGDARITLRGDAEGNILRGENTAEDLFGFAGHDRFLARKGDDRLYGGDGEDILHGGGGDDILSGGAGADRFRFDIQSDDDTIVDFEGEIDLIEILGTGLSFADVEIRQEGGDVLIDYGGQTIRVLDTQASDLGEDNVLVA